MHNVPHFGSIMNIYMNLPLIEPTRTSDFFTLCNYFCYR